VYIVNAMRLSAHGFVRRWLFGDKADEPLNFDSIDFFETAVDLQAAEMEDGASARASAV
jgi:hypothetical protein